MTPLIDVVSPVPPAWWPQLWTWVQEDPAANLDDRSPQTEVAFCAEMASRAQTERTWGVIAAERPVGIIAYRPWTATVGSFHGICFTAAVCGTGVARVAVGRMLDTLWAEGVAEVHATVFADNARVQRFLAHLGAVPLGRIPEATVRGGQPLDLVWLAIVNPAAARERVS